MYQEISLSVHQKNNLSGAFYSSETCHQITGCGTFSQKLSLPNLIWILLRRLGGGAQKHKMCSFSGISVININVHYAIGLGFFTCIAFIISIFQRWMGGHVGSSLILPSRQWLSSGHVASITGCSTVNMNHPAKNNMTGALSYWLTNSLGHDFQKEIHCVSHCCCQVRVFFPLFTGCVVLIISTSGKSKEIFLASPLLIKNSWPLLILLSECA